MPPAQEMPWQAEPHPKGCEHGGQSWLLLQSQAWQGLNRDQDPPGCQSGWRGDAAVLGSSTYSAALGRVWMEAPREARQGDCPQGPNITK